VKKLVSHQVPPTSGVFLFVKMMVDLGMINRITPLLLFIGLAWGQFSTVTKKDVLKKVNTLEEIGEFESAISSLKPYIIKNPESWDIKLRLAQLYKETGNLGKEEIIHAKIVKNIEVPDSILIKSYHNYHRIITEKCEKTISLLKNSIQILDSKEAVELSKGLMNSVKEFPHNNLIIIQNLARNDSLIFFIIADINKNLSRDYYKQAISLGTISSELFSDSQHTPYFMKISELSRLNPPSDDEVNQYDEMAPFEALGSKNYVVTNYFVHDVIRSQCEKFASYFIEIKDWNSAAKCYGLAKEYNLRQINPPFEKNKRWSYGCVLNAINEAIAYRNSNNYHKSLQLFERLKSSVPNVDEWMDMKSRRIWKLYKEMDPSVGEYVEETKTVEENIRELKNLINY